MAVLTTVLDIFGLLLIVSFVALIYWPAALGVTGLLLIVVAWRLNAEPATGHTEIEVA